MLSQGKLALYKEIVEGLHANWTPHEGQIPILRDLFLEDIKSLFVCCGRKFGKSETSLYILWRWAKSFPNSGCYYIAPLQTQAKEIVWANPRLQNFGPRDWLIEDSSGINNTEMRLRFKNGSFIKVDGSDNYDKHRGTEPHIIIYEEFKDHRKQFKEVMTPNLAVFNAPQIFLGTPPEDDGNEAQNEYLLTQKEHETDPEKRFYHAPSWKNPHISKDWLQKEKNRLYARGEGDIWEREYEARYVKGGARKIFPMLSSKIMRPHAEIMHEISRDKKKLEWYVWADPAGASCFAVLFMALNPYTKVWYALDEIYETNQSEMTGVRIGTRINAMKAELFKDPHIQWRQGYDEAATWFANEMLDHFGESFEPTQKMKTDKITGLALLKDILLADKLVLSDRCQKFFWEMDSYRKDESGKIPKKDDHILDAARYTLFASYYTLHETHELHETQNEMFRGARIQDDFPEFNEVGERVDEWD